MHIEESIKIALKHANPIFFKKISEREDFYTLLISDVVELAQASNSLHIWHKLVNHPNLLLTKELLEVFLTSKQYNVYIKLLSSENFKEIPIQHKIDFIEDIYSFGKYNLFGVFAKDLTIPIEKMRTFADRHITNTDVHYAIIKGMCGRLDFPLQSAINYTKSDFNAWIEIVGRLDYPLEDAIKMSIKYRNTFGKFSIISERQDFKTFDIRKLIELASQYDIENEYYWSGICLRPDLSVEDALSIIEFKGLSFFCEHSTKDFFDN
jgi:hypothetical protein